MSRCKTCLFALALILCATPSLAGTLNDDSAKSYLGSTAGFTTYTNGANLTGTVEWAVYGPGDFPVGFLGYTPNPSNLVYAYQILQTGTDPLSIINVNLSGGPASNIGTFTGTSGVPSSSVTGLPALSSTLTSGVLASWTFAGIGAGGTSVGLVYESPNVPVTVFGFVQDGGNPAAVVPLLVPGLVPIPEPASLTMALVGFLGFVGLLLRRRVRR